MLALTRIHLTQDVDWTYTRNSEDVQDVFWTSYVYPVYVLFRGGLFPFSPSKRELYWPNKIWFSYNLAQHFEEKYFKSLEE